MNDYNIIANYLLGNLTYCFEIDGYWFPKFIGKANLDYFRKQELKEESSYVKNFKKDVGGKKYKNFLKNVNTNNVQKIADLLVNEAIDNSYGVASDDITVIVAKILKKK